MLLYDKMLLLIKDTISKVDVRSDFQRNISYMTDLQMNNLATFDELNRLFTIFAQQESGYGWHLDTRRLLRFTARIVNQGNEAFRPILPKQYWEWHACHM